VTRGSDVFFEALLGLAVGGLVYIGSHPPLDVVLTLGVLALWGWTMVSSRR